MEECGGFSDLRLFSDSVKFTVKTKDSKGEMTQREKGMKYCPYPTRINYIKSLCRFIL